MSNIYSMPPDTNEKEKIIGGVFTLGQIMWIGGGGIICLLIILSLFRLFGFISVILGLPFLAGGFYLALKKVNDLPLPTYLSLKKKHKNKIKYYINVGTHKKLEFSQYSRKQK